MPREVTDNSESGQTKISLKKLLVETKCSACSRLKNISLHRVGVTRTNFFTVRLLYFPSLIRSFSICNQSLHARNKTSKCFQRRNKIFFVYCFVKLGTITTFGPTRNVREVTFSRFSEIPETRVLFFLLIKFKM